MGSTPIRVAVAGGSVGGLCAGIALRGVGCEVEVYDRTRGTMSSSGAGIVVQDDLWELLRRHGAPDLPVTSCQQPSYLILAMAVALPPKCSTGSHLGRLFIGRSVRHSQTNPIISARH